MEKTYTMKEIKELAELLQVAQKNTPASTTPTAAPLHGPFHGNAAQYGIFSGAGVRPQRYSTLTRPWSIANVIGIDRSEFTEEILEVMTGVTDETCTNAENFCGNPPQPGVAKTCQQLYKFGKYYIKTNLNVMPYIGELRNRADVPAEILNAGPTGNPFVPDLMYNMRDTRNQLAYELYLVGVEFERALDLVLIQGNIATAYTSTQCGWIVEPNGLDSQIKTGYADNVTNVTCPAMDSYVLTYGANVNTTTADGRNIVQVMEDTMYGLKQRAAKMGMNGVQWVVMMREELWRAFVNNYSCQYDFFGCTAATNTNMVGLANDQNQRRSAMFSSMSIPTALGDTLPVVFSEGLAQTTPAANTMESDLFIVPVSWAGRKLLRWEYFPMDSQYITEFASFTDADITTMNNGMWIVGARSTGLCKEYHFGLRGRLILEAPWLAARIDNLQYTNAAPIRNALPGASYYADGGATYRS